MPGRRLEAAIGSDLVHHLLQLPYRYYETNPSAALQERVRQVDQLRQFLTGHLPLLIVDLAFVGLFLAVLLVIAPALGVVTAAAMPIFALLSVVAQRYQQAHQQASFPRGHGQGLGSGRGHVAGADGEAAGARGGHEAALRAAICSAAPGPACSPGASPTSPPASGRPCSI